MTFPNDPTVMICECKMYALNLMLFYNSCIKYFTHIRLSTHQYRIQFN